MQLLILLGLIVLNGVFAMAEIALVSSSKARLQEDADEGNTGAQVAIDLLEDPNRFLSTVQIGITLIGIVAGAFSGTALADDLARMIERFIPVLSSVALELGFGLIVALTTYLSLVIGELVPKRIALHDPETVAAVVARPMQILAKVTAPVVWGLTKSTEFIAGLLGVQGDDTRFITDFEVIAMMREGIEKGEFDTDEHSMVKGALELDDTRIRQIATPRTEVVWLDINATEDELRERLGTKLYTAYPVCDGGIDEVVGVVRSKDMLTHILGDGNLDLKNMMRETLFVPETAIAADVLQKFKRSVVRMAIVIGEYGGVEGVVTLNDIVEEVFGDLDMQDVEPEQDGQTWFFDGQYPIVDLTFHLDSFYLPEDEAADYHTVGGFILKRLGHIPHPDDTFSWHGFRVRVLEMAGQRVKRVEIAPEDS